MANNINIGALSEKAASLRNDIGNKAKVITPWPQTTITPGFSNSSGFLPPLLILPSKEFKKTENSDGSESLDSIKKKVGNYEYEDWIGQKITTDGLIPLSQNDKFSESKDVKTRDELKSSPYSTRDSYIVYGDYGTDYFKHGLQVVNNLMPFDNTADSTLAYEQFKNTPFENNDPVIFGFEIIINVGSSPLLNGSINDFLNNYQNISEIRSRIQVYEDFKQQFVKFFRTNEKLNINSELPKVSSTRSEYPNSESQKQMFQGNRKSYLNYYLKKVEGLDNLVESNTSAEKKFLVDYRKDVIKLEFTEDVSLSLGTLAHLYKLLYWSKPNGKNLIPENLLRFNCDIIVSECRNFSRVRKALNGNGLDVLKDNLSRYVYSLKECQFFFKEMPHPSSINLGEELKTFDSYTMEFDYKYSTVLFERFMEGNNGFGQYVGYDSGAIWKIGNKGERNNRTSNSSVNSSSSPKFFTVGGNKFNQNGVNNPFILNTIGTLEPINLEARTFTKPELNGELVSKVNFSNKPKQVFLEKERELNFIERLKNSTITNAKRELSSYINSRVNLLSRTLNKLAIGFVGGKGVTPPKNIYTEAYSYQGSLTNAMGNIGSRFFYDIRNEVANFAGNVISDLLNGKGKLNQR